MNGLRPEILDDFGIIAALDHLVRESRSRTQASIEWSCRGGFNRLAPPPNGNRLRATVGAYYFDCWSSWPGTEATRLLETEYAERMPVWGWRDDTVDIMQRQIDYCADHGIGFWAFDWYYPESEKKETPLNDALSLYLKTPNRQ